jgi:hypothetical protein
MAVTNMFLKYANNNGNIMRSTGVWSIAMERYPGTKQLNIIATM